MRFVQREHIVAACLVGSVVIVVGFASGLGIHATTTAPSRPDTRADSPEHPAADLPVVAPPEPTAPRPAHPPIDPIAVAPAPAEPVRTTPTDTPDPTHSHPAPTTPAPTTPPPSPPDCVPGTVPALLDTLTGAVTVLPLDPLTGAVTALPLDAVIGGLTTALPPAGSLLPTGLGVLPVSGAGLDGSSPEGDLPLDSLLRTCAPEASIDTSSGG